MIEKIFFCLVDTDLLSYPNLVDWSGLIFIFVILTILNLYSRTSMARTLMVHSHGLARTIIMVPMGHYMHNTPWIAGTTHG